MKGSSKLAMEGEEVWDEPVSPMGQYCNSSVFSLAILVAFESKVPINDSLTMSTLQNLFLPINPRFSSVMVKDKGGIPKWKRVNVTLEDHVNIPVLPAGLEFYDECLKEYLSKVASDQLPQSRPLWDIHLFKYPTRTAAGTLVIKLHHSLGDGFSLMGALLSCLQRADDPSLPLTIPSKQQLRHSNFSNIASRIFSVFYNTVHDFSLSLLKSSVVEDDITPIRSGAVGVEFHPFTISTVTFSLDDIKQIKAKLKGTVNDVLTGIVFYGIQLYMQAAGRAKAKGTTKVTALVLFNTRAIKTFQTIDEMTKPGSKSPWGNNFTFLPVSIPECFDVEKVDPLDFIHQAKQVIKMKKNSLAFFLTGGLLEIMRKLKGPEATARYMYATIKNTSLGISNMVGPVEQVQIAGHPIEGMYFMVIGTPQNLTTTIVSYMGNVRIAFGTDINYINSNLLVACMEKSFERMYEAAIGNKI